MILFSRFAFFKMVGNSLYPKIYHGYPGHLGGISQVFYHGYPDSKISHNLSNLLKFLNPSV